MKVKFFFLMFLLAVSAGRHMFAQDRIITKDGETMEVYNVEISDKYIFYNKDKSKDSAFERMAKESVLMIKRQDGSIVNLYETAEGKAEDAPAEKPAAGDVPAQEAVILTPDLLDEAAREANAAAIEQLNKPVAFVADEADDLDKEANSVWCRMGVKGNSVLDDGMVSLSILSGGFEWQSYKGPAVFKEGINNGFNPGLQVAVTNKGTRTIYIDLGNSFFTRMGQPQCYYIPSATSVTSTTGTGASVNLGAVTGALGIGGIAGTLANGVNVGSGNSKGATTVTYTQRIITVPPHSTVKLEPQYLFGTENCVVTPGLVYGLFRGYKYLRTSRFSFPKDAPEGPLMNGQHFTYNEETSAVTVSALVAYSFSENGSASRTLSIHLYLKDLVGRNRNKFSYSYRGQVSYDIGTIVFEGNVEDRKGGYSFPRQ